MRDTDAELRLVEEWHELLARHAAVTCALERELQEHHDIGISEFEALELLVRGGKDKYRAQELTDVLTLSQSAGSRLIGRMERHGLVVRALCDLDRRGIFVQLTDLGAERYEAARPTQRAVLAATLGAVSASATGAGATAVS